MFADSRLGSHPVVRAGVFWLDGRALIAGESAPSGALREDMRVGLDDSIEGYAFRQKAPIKASASESEGYALFGDVESVSSSVLRNSSPGDINARAKRRSKSGGK